MENMTLWDKVRKPPQSALREIKGGRMNGKTDINPTWRMQAMTEHFGPCGIGWRYTIDKLWTEPGPGGDVMAFALVSVSYRNGGVGEWSEPVPGIGGNMIVTKENSGLRASDEAYKMAVTDALSVAFKALGFGAEVYLGNFDGSKWRGDQSDGQGKQPAKAEPKHDAKQVVEEEERLASAIVRAESVGRCREVYLEITNSAILPDERKAGLWQRCKDRSNAIKQQEESAT